MGYTTTRVCMYRTSWEEGANREAVAERVRAAGAQVMPFNDKIVAVEAFPDADGLVTHMEFRHRDQWWIRRKAPHVAVAILVRAGIDVSKTKLIDIVKPQDVPPRP